MPQNFYKLQSEEFLALHLNEGLNILDTFDYSETLPAKLTFDEPGWAQ